MEESLSCLFSQMGGVVFITYLLKFLAVESKWRSKVLGLHTCWKGRARTNGPILLHLGALLFSKAKS